MLVSFILACTTQTLKKAEDEEPSTVQGCRSGERAASQPETLLFSTPYDINADQSPMWRTALIDNELELQDEILNLGRANQGSPRFTPDASWGIAVLDNGNVSSVTVDTDGRITPLDIDLDLGIFVTAIEISSNGEELWLLDSNWPENGGGLYKSQIDCETGSVSPPEKVLTTKNGAALMNSANGMWIAAREANGETGQAHVFQDNAVRTYSIFQDDEAILSDIAQTTDGRIVIGDINEFSGIPTRIGWLTESGETGTLNIEDPVRLLASPINDQLFILSGYQNATYLLHDGSVQEPDYMGSSPQLPTAAVQTGDGRIYIAENQGIRGMRFTANGLDDDGILLELNGLEGITGALGISR